MPTIYGHVGTRDPLYKELLEKGKESQIGNAWLNFCRKAVEESSRDT